MPCDPPKRKAKLRDERSPRCFGVSDAVAGQHLKGADVRRWRRAWQAVTLQAPPPAIGHIGEVADIVEAVLYLESASFMTGEILHVEGGQSAGP